LAAWAAILAVCFASGVSLLAGLTAPPASGSWFTVVAPGTRSLRTVQVRWLGACAALYVGTALVIATLAGSELRWVPIALLALVMAFCILAGMRIGQGTRATDTDAAPDGLEEAYDRARLEVLRDELTGLGNHRAFQEELDRQVARVRAEPGSIALLLVDVDDLKKTNETQGHAAGDDLLRATARIILGSLHRSGRGFRIGGDEFAVLLMDCAPAEAAGIGRHILAGASSPTRRAPPSTGGSATAAPTSRCSIPRGTASRMMDGPWPSSAPP